MDLMEKICCTLASKEDLEALRAAPCRMVEVRLDLLGGRNALGLVEELATSGYRVVATLRDSHEGGSYTGPDGEKVDVLLNSLNLGAALIDVEYRFGGLLEVLESAPGKVIVSFHDYRWTPEAEVLYAIAGDMVRIGAAVAKVVTTARSVDDNLRLLGLNAWRPGRVVAFAMGALGRLSRVLAPLYGAPFTYAALGRSVAPGQPTVNELLEAWRLLGLLDTLDTGHPRL
jgi:3-dehydroquinate dehydratase-1